MKKIDKLVYDNLIFTKSFNGIKCNRCGVIQGLPNKGFKRYYCEHITKRIDDYQKEETKRISDEIVKEVAPQRSR